MIYLDNAATTLPCPEALAAAAEAASRPGNPSSLHQAGRAARALLEQSRAAVAEALDAPPGCLIFTSGGTESINAALRGAAAVYGRRKKTVVTTALEHPATRRTLAALQVSDGISAVEVPPGKDGRIDPDALAAAVTEDTFLVSAVMVSSDTGSLLDVRAAAPAGKARNPHNLFHLDAVQGFLKLPLRPLAWSIDLVSLSAHKVHGLVGLGGLLAAPGVRLRPLLTGGAQEGGRRAGTEALPLAAGLAAAVGAWRPIPPELKEEAVSLLSALPGCVVLPAHDAPHILAASLPGAPGEVLVRVLSDEGYAVGSGSACAGGHRGHALEAMRLPPKVSDSVVRLSFSRYTALPEVRGAVEALGRAAARIRGRT